MLGIYWWMKTDKTLALMERHQLFITKLKGKLLFTTRVDNKENCPS